MSPETEGLALGPYVLLSRIGEGGMGEVWKARDTRLNRIVAIKRLKGEHSRRFEQEARAVAALNHPHICTLFDIGPDYLVMEYIEGTPLRGPLPFEEALRIALQITGALESAHQAGIIHRDLKPANVLLAKSGAKLLDFGLAKVTNESPSDATTLAGGITGTAAYMSPEQARGEPLDRRSDIFSFGAVLYEMLCGRQAFGASSMLETLNAVVKSDPELLDSPMRDVVKRCLAKDRGQRFQTMAEVRTALEQTSAHAAEKQPSIAVLPFANMSADKDNEFFSDGLAEEILNSLAQIQGLKVIARTSSFAFRGKEQDIVEIARKLRVRTILEGSVRRSGNRIRVTAQLIEAEEGTHLWSQRYDRELEDVFAVQDEIASAIAEALRVKLVGGVGKGYKPNLPAYEALLKGFYHLQRNTPEAHARAKIMLEQAVSFDPQYARAHAELGIFYLVLGAWGLAPVSEMMKFARTHAGRALDLDPEEPQAHIVLGAVSGVYDRDWKKAVGHFRCAMTSEALPAATHARYAAFYLLPVGRMDEAKTEMDRAIEGDPLSFLWRCFLTAILAGMNRHEEAILEARKALEINENSWLAYQWLSISCTFLGRLKEARRAAEEACRLAPWNSHAPGVLAATLRLLDEPDPEGPLNNAGPGGRAIYHLLCSEIEAAAEWYEKAVQQHDIPSIVFNCGHLYKPLRLSRRWPAIAKMLNLPERV